MRDFNMAILFRKYLHFEPFERGKFDIIISLSPPSFLLLLPSFFIYFFTRGARATNAPPPVFAPAYLS